MSRVATRGAIWVLRGLFVVTVLALAIAAATTRIGPLFGHEVFVIRGASMRPAIAMGAAIVASRTMPQDIVAGDIVTFRGTNGVVVTHRVVETVVHEGEYLYRTKGDANASEDPFLVPQGAIIGVVVRTQIPYAGYLMALMAQPSGLLSMASALIACYLAMSMLEDQRPRRGRSPKRGGVPSGIPA